MISLTAADLKSMSPQELGSRIVAWLETKDPAKEYDYLSNTNCAMAQFFTAQGFEKVNSWPGGFRFEEDGEREEVEFPAVFDQLACSSWQGEVTETFGAYLSRLRAHLESLG